MRSKITAPSAGSQTASANANRTKTRSKITRTMTDRSPWLPDWFYVQPHLLNNDGGAEYGDD
jgi:hypothetical protein